MAAGWKPRRSRLALKIYAIGLVQFIVVAIIMEIDHRVIHGPPPRPPAAERGALRGEPPHGHRPRPGPPGPPWLGLPGLFVLVVVGVGSWLTARSIAAPLGRLADAAHAFGGGKLDARARIERTDEIGEVSRAFDDMADRIAKLLLAERELLANVSHELRTPLARIRVALDLANEADPREAVASLGEIAQDLSELEHIVDEVLAAARLALDADAKSGPGLPMHAEALDTRAMLERSAAKFRAAHPTRELRARLADDLPKIDADPVLIRRVVDNLLDNAHKYTEDPTEPIALEARADGDHVVIEVADRGVGIAKEDLARLFEPFFRADRSRTRATGGLGLGLALARRVVDAHGGTIAFTSELGAGTVARVRLPSRSPARAQPMDTIT
ncbi:MAG: HAMP domain-containing histidine kinase [Labilithrix sp.]|nr:HAMP domain-containing histidine kinase [Labilithrix sp.]